MNTAADNQANNLEKITGEKIAGVVLKQLKTHPDDRGFFRELVRGSDSFFSEGFGQWSHSKMQKNTVKAWHFHHKQTDWWYVGMGVLQCVLYDNRAESPSYQQKMEFKLGESEIDKDALAVVLKIPPGVLHGCKTLTDFASMFYITSHEYDPEDEGRLPYNSEVVNYDWGDENQLIVAINDLREHIPSYPRSTS